MSLLETTSFVLTLSPEVIYLPRRHEGDVILLMAARIGELVIAAPPSTFRSYDDLILAAEMQPNTAALIADELSTDLYRRESTLYDLSDPQRKRRVIAQDAGFLWGLGEDTPNAAFFSSRYTPYSIPERGTRKHTRDTIGKILGPDISIEEH